MSVQSSAFEFGVNVGSFSCEMVQNSVDPTSILYASAALWLFIPAFIPAASAINVMLLHFKRKACPRKKFLNEKTNKQRRNVYDQEVGSDEMTEEDKKKRKKRKERLPQANLAQYFWTGTAVVFFGIHPTLVAKALQLFACGAVDAAATDYRLLADLSVPCGDELHNTMIAAVGLPLVGLYVILAPILALLYMRKHHEADDYLSFLSAGFRPERYYWFLVIMFRKVVLVAITAFFVNSAVMQLVAINILLLGCCFLQVLGRPYELHQLNYAEVASLLVSATL